MSRLMMGVSGVRGIVGEALTEEVAEGLGRSFAAMLGGGGRIALGRDSRPSGPALSRAIVEGLTAGGISVVDLGVVSTPGVALMIRRLEADGGVVVTASHNPLPYNGIKFMSPAGLNLPAEEADRLRQIWSSGPPAPTGPRGTVTQDERTHELHVAAACGIIDAAAVAARGYKVVLDSVNGAGGAGGAMLLRRLGCELVHINAEPTGEFAHAPEPVAANLTGLCDAVAAGGADVGFAQDPDADRLVIVDETGRFLGEEYTLALTSAFVLRGRRGDLATNLSTSRMMDDVAASAQVTLHRAPVGEAHVAARMIEAGCVFGGEGNGGVIHPDVVMVRDSLVGMALTLACMAETHRTIGELADELPKYHMLKDKFPCPQAAADEVLAAARAALAGRDGARINETDGLRVDLPEGWVHVRASNTEPIVRITAEAADPDDARRLAAEVRRLADAVTGGGG